MLNYTKYIIRDYGPDCDRKGIVFHHYFTSALVIWFWLSMIMDVQFNRPWAFVWDYVFFALAFSMIIDNYSNYKKILFLRLLRMVK